MSVTTVKDEVVQGFLVEYLARLRAEYDPVHLILFGSRATGTAHEESDIDLVIVGERFREIKLVDRGYHVKTTLDLPPGLDLLCYTPDEFEQLREGFGLVADICREGLWLIRTDS